MDIKNIFGKNLKNLRKSRGLTQEKLAELSNLDRSYISDIEGGRVNVSLESIYKIAIGLEVEIVDLFNFK